MSRPANKQYHIKSNTLGFRPSAEIRQLLEIHAAEAGHSLSREVELRIVKGYELDHNKNLCRKIDQLDHKIANIIKAIEQ